MGVPQGGCTHECALEGVLGYGVSLGGLEPVSVLWRGYFCVGVPWGAAAHECALEGC